MNEIILASTSPRRKYLLKKAGIKFKAVDSKVKEYFDPKLKPHKLVEKLSLEKAQAVQKKFKQAIVIAADTLVAYGEKIMGKPKDREDAKMMLKILSGKTHSIVTGLTIINGITGKIITRSEETKITMKIISEEEIESYVLTPESVDKAGAYAVQGKAAKFIKKIEGDLSNAIGLPINSLLQDLKSII